MGSPPPLAELLAEAASELSGLLAETDAAEARGLPVYPERTTLEVASYFLEVARSDNFSWVQEVLAAHYEAFYTAAPSGTADALAATLPLREVRGVSPLEKRNMQVKYGCKLGTSPRC
jgi:hypothetical protein